MNRSVTARIALVSAVCLIAALPVSAAQDPVLELTGKARKAYKNEHYKEAHDLLQQAVARIGKRITSSFVPFLPEAPEGWEIDGTETNTLSAATSSGPKRVMEAERRYIRKEDKRDVTLMIANTPELIRPYRQMAKSAAMMKPMLKQRGITLDEKAGWYIFTEQRGPDDCRIVAVHEQVVVEVDGAGQEKTAAKFIDEMKLDKLAQTASR
ncbi:hypothetical protein [Kiritimatiella glycovorans]|uniref:Uncharacterized protein n=1 Tax=Kiritimatiella glycovorans TaxID=1307763 RepID=A0A0G3EGV0_9BACT|nr:hypothetical protein [Kiritimatiella glycovorans]AKJ65701.1 hypothetical protein L21SP4_02479 [Kiritimatiella glycovorans]